MGRSAGDAHMPELMGTPNEVKWEQHFDFLETLEEKGYKLESQEASEEKATDGHVVAKIVVSVLEPEGVSELPCLKFEAEERFGYYDYDKNMFDAWDDPRFQVSTYQRPSDINSMNDPWEKINLGE